MTTVVATHAVGNMDTWLGGGDVRKALFANFCSSYRIFRHTDGDRVSLVWEGVDLEKMQALLSSTESEAAKAKHTVIDPIEVYIEIDGGS
ncbi:MAG: hypothetical protein ACTSX7_11000 [Alphaproteobacteria bacterium]